MSILTTVISSVIKPVAGIFQKKEERKLTKIKTQAKIAHAKEKNETEITLTDADWESLSIKSQDETWKDEYITVLITLPIAMLLAGGIWLAFTGDSRLLDGTNTGIKALSEAGVDMGKLMYAVVLAAVGLKMWRAR